MLVVDDEPPITARPQRRAHGPRLPSSRSPPTGQRSLGQDRLRRPAAIILDLGLPDLDGIEVCRRIRAWSDVPIIVLTADGAEDRKVRGLDDGADDYVTKPFSTPELLARLRVALRHRRPAPGRASTKPSCRVGDLVRRHPPPHGRSRRAAPSTSRPRSSPSSPCWPATPARSSPTA